MSPLVKAQDQSSSAVTFGLLSPLRDGYCRCRGLEDKKFILNFILDDSRWICILIFIYFFIGKWFPNLKIPIFFLSSIFGHFPKQPLSIHIFLRSTWSIHKWHLIHDLSLLKSSWKHSISKVILGLGDVSFCQTRTSSVFCLCAYVSRMDVKSLQPSVLFLQPCAKALDFGGLILVGLVFGPFSLGWFDWF